MKLFSTAAITVGFFSSATAALAEISGNVDGDECGGLCEGPEVFSVSKNL